MVLRAVAVAALLAASPTPAPEAAWLDQLLTQIGGPAPAQGLEGERAPGYQSGLPVPAPWTHLTYSLDKDGRVAGIALEEDCCDNAIIPDAQISMGPRTVYVPPRTFLEHRALVTRYAVARFGPAVLPFGAEAGIFEWDFVIRFARCEGAKAVFESTAHEPTGRLASVRLETSNDRISLDLVGRKLGDDARNVDAGPEDRARQSDSCKLDHDFDQWMASPTRLEDARRDCLRTPDTCTYARGVLLYHQSRHDRLFVPCPPGTDPKAYCLGPDVIWLMEVDPVTPEEQHRFVFKARPKR